MGNFCILAILAVFACSVDGSLVGKFIRKQEILGSKLNILNRPNSVIFSENHKPVDANEITSILSLALGFSVPEEIAWRGLMSGNPFNKPNAVLMFTVDSVPTSQELKLPSTLQLPVKVNDDSSRAEILAIAEKKSLTGHISEIFNEKSNTISLSASEDLAAAGYSDSERSQTVLWSDKDDAWVILSGKKSKAEVLFTKAQLLAEMSKIFNSNGISFDKKKNAIKVTMKTAEILFDLNKQGDWLFFSELALTQLMYARVAAKPELVKDDIPDIFMFGISGLKGLQSKYGASSPQVKAAIHVLEKFIPLITEKFVKLYGGKILAVELTFKKNEISSTDDMESTKKIYDHVKPHLGDQDFVQFQEKFPELHIFDAMEKKAKKSLCEQMASLLSGFGVGMKLKCSTGEEHDRLRRRSLLAVKTPDANSLNIASYYDQNFPVIFNLWFWLVVVIALAVYVISLVLWYMDPGRDSIIYRMTNQRIKTD